MENFIKGIKEQRDIESQNSQSVPSAEVPYFVQLEKFKNGVNLRRLWIEEFMISGEYDIAKCHLAWMGNELAKLHERMEKIEKEEKKKEDCGCIHNITEKEFDSYLESIGGLENGHYPDRPNIMTCKSFEIGPGWYGLVKTLIEKAIAAGWNKQILQVKEKFGSLRFYFNDAPQEVHDIINKYEELSGRICEECGEAGEIRNYGWMKTLCNKHHNGEK